MLQYVAMCCSVLQLEAFSTSNWEFLSDLRYGLAPAPLTLPSTDDNARWCVAVCCSVLQGVAVCCRVLQGVAGCYRVLQGVAVCCCVMQCVAVCRSVYSPSASHPPVLRWQYQVVCCSVLQCSAVCSIVW